MPENQPPPERKILHVDADAFYCSVEERDDPTLKGRAFAVGGKVKRSGVIATCNYVAREVGVRSAMPSYKAIQQCPNLLILPPRFDAYKEASRQLHAIFHHYTDIIEPLALDEAYLDVTGTNQCRGSGTLMARAIRAEVEQHVGITVSVGVAPNKFLAKIASDWNKPNGLCVIAPEDVQDFIFELPVEKLHGVGKVTAGKLHSKGITTCRQLRLYSRLELSLWFGSFGEQLWALCRGIDDRELQVARRRKSLSVERTYDYDLHNEEAILSEVVPLLDDLSIRYKDISHEYAVTKRFVKVKFTDFTQTTWEEVIESYDQKPDDHFRGMLIKAWERSHKPVRLLGIGVRLLDLKVSGQMRQLKLFKKKSPRPGL